MISTNMHWATWFCYQLDINEKRDKFLGMEISSVLDVIISSS